MERGRIKNTERERERVDWKRGKKDGFRVSRGADVEGESEKETVPRRR